MSSPQPNRSAERERPLVLVVEDQAELRRLYVEQLEISGFDVIEAGNGEEAIFHTSARTPDVVLMDLSLPVLDGWEATRRL
jgi:CheY-like chemotaxis protein